VVLGRVQRGAARGRRGLTPDTRPEPLTPAGAPPSTARPPRAPRRHRRETLIVDHESAAHEFASAAASETPSASWRAPRLWTD